MLLNWPSLPRNTLCVNAPLYSIPFVLQASFRVFVFIKRLLAKKSLEKIYLIASENVRFIIFDFLLPSLRHKVQILFTPENVKNACKSLSRVFVQCLDENASQETSETRLQQRLSFSNVDINHFSLHNPQRGTVGTEFIPQ